MPSRSSATNDAAHGEDDELPGFHERKMVPGVLQNAEDDFPVAAALAGAEDGFLCLGDGVFALDFAAEEAAGGECEQLFKHFVAVVGGGFLVPPGDPEAAEADVLEDEEAVWDADGLHGHGAVGDVRAARGEGVGDGEGALAADGIEGELDRCAAGAGGDFLAEVGGIEEDGIGAEGFEFGARGLRGGRCSRCGGRGAWRSRSRRGRRRSSRHFARSSRRGSIPRNRGACAMLWRGLIFEHGGGDGVDAFGHGHRAMGGADAGFAP